MHQFNEVEMVKGYAMPSDEGGVDYGRLHAEQRFAAFAGYDGGPGIPGPVGRAGRGVPAYVTQTIPALSGYRGFGDVTPPCPEGYDYDGRTCRSREVKTGAKIGLMVGLGVIIAYVLG